MKLKMNMQAIKPAVIAALAAVAVVSPLAVRADAPITLSGMFTTNCEFTVSSIAHSENLAGDRPVAR